MEFGVATQNNIGTTACHVGRNGHRAFTACLRHNGGFISVLFGVQHAVRNAKGL